MMRKDVVIAVLTTFCLTSSLFMIASTVGYDPWADINDDGKIDMKDIGYTAKLFGTTGDPAKNVTVTNWPVSADVTVWYNNYVDTLVQSDYYEASGFGQLHMLTYASGLTDTETATLKIIGRLWNVNHTGSTGIVVYEAYFRAGATTENFKGITIPVPSGNFYFFVTTEGTGDCYFYLSFYLTWA